MRKPYNQQSNVSKERDECAVIEDVMIQLLEPLAKVVKGAGLSAADLYSLYEITAVRLEAKTQKEGGSAINISEIAAITGIPRGTVSLILKAKNNNKNVPVSKKRQPANRVLRAWQEKSKFQTKGGEPASLSMYGKGASFDTLVKDYGAGVPTRAVLDALVRADAVQIVSGDVITLKTNNLCRINADVPLLELLVQRLRRIMDCVVKAAIAPPGSRFFSGEYRIPMPSLSRRQIHDELIASGFHLTLRRETSALEAQSKPFLGRESAKADAFLTLFCHERNDFGSTRSFPKRKRSHYKRKS